MRIPRIYQSQTLQPRLTINLSDNAARHVQQVLRLSAGAQLILFNGMGGQYQAVIKSMDKRVVTVEIGEFSAIECESPLQIHLAQAISRGEKMDFTIQKAVELGVTEITPIISERCNVKLSHERFEKKMAHWQAIIISACEQSARNQIPLIHPPVHLNDWLAQSHQGMKLILHPSPQLSPLKEKQAQKNITVLVGSEGGFTPDEINWAIENQFQPLTLGPRVLRTETAALAVISVLQGMWGDFINEF